MPVPSERYLECMDTGQYQRAATDQEMIRQAKERRDPVARAYLLIAEAHRDAVTGDEQGARARFSDAIEVLDRAEESWEVNALLQHSEQCIEYLGMGKPLPDLPAGL